MLVSTQERVSASTSNKAFVFTSNKLNMYSVCNRCSSEAESTISHCYLNTPWSYFTNSKRATHENLDHILITHRLPFNPTIYHVDLGLLADVSSWSFSTWIPPFSPSLSRPRAHVEATERFWKAERPPIQSSQTEEHLWHNSSEEDHVSHLKTFSAVCYQLLGTKTTNITYACISYVLERRTGFQHSLWSHVVNWCRTTKT